MPFGRPVSSVWLKAWTQLSLHAGNDNDVTLQIIYMKKAAGCKESQSEVLLSGINILPNQFLQGLLIICTISL